MLIPLTINNLGAVSPEFFNPFDLIYFLNYFSLLSRQTNLKYFAICQFIQVAYFSFLVLCRSLLAEILTGFCSEFLIFSWTFNYQIAEPGVLKLSPGFFSFRCWFKLFSVYFISADFIKFIFAKLLKYC